MKKCYISKIDLILFLSDDLIELLFEGEVVFLKDFQESDEVVVVFEGLLSALFEEEGIFGDLCGVFA